MKQENKNKISKLLKIYNLREIDEEDLLYLIGNVFYEENPVGTAEAGYHDKLVALCEGLGIGSDKVLLAASPDFFKLLGETYTTIKTATCTIDGAKPMPDEQVFRCDDIMDFMRGFGK